jgi:hypothetical protein
MASRLALACAALAERRLPSDGVRLLLNHPRNEQLVMEGSRFFYVPPQAHGAQKKQSWVPLKGLTSLLREFYWPDHNPWGGGKRKRGGDGGDADGERPRKKQKMAEGGQRATGWAPPILSATGCVQGSIVHRQLGEYINLGRDAFLQQNRHIHPLVRVALAALSKGALYPLVGEYRVACVDARLGTALDILAVNMNTGRPTWIEVKTAASLGAFERVGQGAFAGRLATINTAQKGALLYSDCSRARVQLGISVAMAVEGTRYTGGFDALVLLLANDQAEGKFYPVTDAFLHTYAVPLYLDIQKRLPEWRKKKKKKKDHS